MDIDFFESLKNVFKISFLLNVFPQFVHDLHFIMDIECFSHPEHMKQMLVMMMLDKFYPKPEDLSAVIMSFYIASFAKDMCVYHGLSKNTSDILSFFLRFFIRNGRDTLDLKNIFLAFIGLGGAFFAQELEKTMIKKIYESSTNEYFFSF